jgi:hypothetical protein
LAGCFDPRIIDALVFTLSGGRAGPTPARRPPPELDTGLTAT